MLQDAMDAEDTVEDNRDVDDGDAVDMNEEDT
jgi:hypothetical protein